MRETFSERHPIIISIAYAILAVIFAIAAGIIISISGADKIQQCLIQAACFGLSALFGLFIMKKSRYTLKDYGFRFSSREARRAVLWYFPIVLVEIEALFAGPIPVNEIGTGFVAAAFLFTLAVGVNEEVYFRGLILKVLNVKGTRFAIILSSVIFGIAHMPNILAGKTIPYIILQITFAFVFGFVCALIVVKTKSIVAPVIWHFTHDFIAMVTGTDVITTQALVILALQVAILVIYSVILLQKPGKASNATLPT
jgi:membrane protease YdiL (CAAX protease family)